MAGFFSKLRGTFSSIFMLGKTGPNLKANSGAIEARDNGDTAFAVVRGATPIAANDLVTKAYADALPVPYELVIGGDLSTPTLPLSGAGAEIISKAATLVSFNARRGVVGVSGTTTVQLEVNGVGTGPTLSWTSADAAFALKSAVISIAVTTGDRLSLVLSSAEVGGADIYAEAA